MRSVVGFFIAVLLLGLPVAASALDCAVVSLVRVGSDPRFEGAMVQLKDEVGTCWAGGVRQFYLSSTLGDQGLATLLTGYSLTKTFWVRIGGDGSAGSLVQIIFINN